MSRDEVQAQGASFHGNRAAACELTRHAKLSNKLNSEHRLGMATYTGDRAVFLQTAVALQEERSLHIQNLSIPSLYKRNVSTGDIRFAEQIIISLEIIK